MNPRNKIRLAALTGIRLLKPRAEGRFAPAIFKAYDIRGIYPREINEEVIEKITAALAQSLAKGRIVIGHDARLSSPQLYRAALNALKAQGYKLKAIPAGLITTPMLAFLVNKLKAKMGLMITASHNPQAYNGLKVVKKGAVPMSGKELEKLVMSYEK